MIPWGRRLLAGHQGALSGLHELGEFIGGHGFAEQETLAFFTLVSPEEVQLLTVSTPSAMMFRSRLLPRLIIALISCAS